MKRTNESPYLLGDVHILITEWVPLGVNNVVLLSDRLETFDRQPLYRSGQLDHTPELPIVSLPPIETKITVTKYKPTDYVEFMADLSYKETGGAMQDEQFGVHVDASGRITYGTELHMTDEQSDVHTLDVMSRVLADIVQDTSLMMETLLSNYQKRLLNLVYYGESIHRDKFVAMMAKSLHPVKDDPEEYIKNRELRASLRQILNDMGENAARRLNEGESVFIGSSGVLLVAPEPRKYEKILYLYSLLKGIEVTQKNMFARMWVAWEEIDTLKKRLTKRAFSIEAQQEISELSGDIALFGAMLEYIEKSLSTIKEEMPDFTMGLSDDEDYLLKILDIPEIMSEVNHRVEDAIFVVEDLEKEIKSLEVLAGAIHEKETRKVFHALRDNTAHSVAIGEALELLEALIVGAYFVELMHLALRFSGSEEWLIEHKFLGISDIAWLFIGGGIGIVIVAWYVIQWKKRRTIRRFRARHRY